MHTFGLTRLYAYIRIHTFQKTLRQTSCTLRPSLSLVGVVSFIIPNPTRTLAPIVSTNMAVLPRPIFASIVGFSFRICLCLAALNEEKQKFPVSVNVFVILLLDNVAI